MLQRIPELKQLAEELFPGEVCWAIETDPELPSEHYVLFDVSSSDEYSEISKRERVWFEKASELLGDDCDKVRLFVGLP